MNRLTLFLFTAAFVGLAPASARADRAALSFRTGGVALSVTAEEAAPAAVEPDSPVVLDADTESRPFIPDVYASRPEAARAAAMTWATIDPRCWENPPTRIRVMSDDQSLFTAIREGIRARRPGVRVEPCDGTLCGGGPAPSGEVWLYVTLPAGGVSVRGAGWSDAVATTAYVEKPWVANYADFVAHSPGRWVVARSDPYRPATTPGEAAEQARRAAVDDVIPLVTARMRDGNRFDRGRLHRLVETHLLGDRLVHDRFPQKYERPYGSLYRETILVDASDARIDGLARDVRRSLDVERQSRVGGLAGAGAVLLVTYALYRFANAFTRGYFTWSLRTAAAVVAAGAVTLLVAAA